MAILKKSIQLWKGRTIGRSEASFEFMTKDLKDADAQLKKMNVENWKHYFIGLYFNVSLSYDELVVANNKSHELYLKVLDLQEKILRADSDQDREIYLGKFSIGIFDLCSQMMLFTTSYQRT